MRGLRQASHRSRRRWRSSKLRNCKDCRREGCRRYRLSSHVGRFEQASQRAFRENDRRRSNFDEVSNELHFRKFGAAPFNRGRATIHQPMHKTAGHRTSIKKCTCRGGPDRRIFPNVTGGGRSMHFPFCSHFERLPSFPPSWIADCSKVLIIEKNFDVWDPRAQPSDGRSPSDQVEAVAAPPTETSQRRFHIVRPLVQNDAQQ